MKRRVVLLVGAMALTLAMFGGVALAKTFTCTTDPCRGTSNADEITGTDGAETIKALAGADRVRALSGNDIVYGGAGTDFVDGYGGNDIVYGDDGGDYLAGAEDSDKVYGGKGGDDIDATVNDASTMDSSATVDYSYGQSGNDTILAQDGNTDIIDCGENRRDEDTIFYDVGLDTIENCEIKNP